jgi:hypothetical protein
MQRSFATLAVMALACGVGGLSILSAQSGGTVDVLVSGAPRPQYQHDGRAYVEAIKGREYAIRLRNPYGVRVAVALSVDGLNTIDARHTTAADARKWIIDPYQTITISGWQTSQTAARRFEFTNEERSYAEALGTPSDMGIISAVYFRERVHPILRDQTSGDRPGRFGDFDGRNEAKAAPAPAPPEAQAAPAQGGQGAAAKREREDYAATGMGRQTDHAVTQIHVDLEETPAQRVDIRYEFRPQLVRLGILPDPRVPDPLRRREGASGFEPGFSPVPPSLR